MNSQCIKVTTPSDGLKVDRLRKRVPRKKMMEIRHLFLISRIMISIFTIGLIGYALDRVRQGSMAKR